MTETGERKDVLLNGKVKYVDKDKKESLSASEDESFEESIQTTENATGGIFALLNTPPGLKRSIATKDIPKTAEQTTAKKKLILKQEKTQEDHPHVRSETRQSTVQSKASLCLLN